MTYNFSQTSEISVDDTRAQISLKGVKVTVEIKYAGLLAKFPENAKFLVALLKPRGAPLARFDTDETDNTVGASRISPAELSQKPPGCVDLRLPNQDEFVISYTDVNSVSKIKFNKSKRGPLWYNCFDLNFEAGLPEDLKSFSLQLY